LPGYVPVSAYASELALGSLAVLLRSRAEVVHEAFVEYLAHHREELTRLYDQTQKAIAAGDLESLARASGAARQAEVDAIMADPPA
jgi:hypothetical protein